MTHNTGCSMKCFEFCDFKYPPGSMTCALCHYNPTIESCYDQTTTCSGDTPLCMTSYIQSKFDHTLIKRYELGYLILINY